MPRARRKTAARDSRNSGEMSGVTIYSLPSGTTIDKTGISAGTMTAASTITTATGLQVTSGASIALYKVQNNKGFMVGHPTYGGLIMETGVTTATGAETSWSLGTISNIMHISGSVIVPNGSVSAYYVTFTNKGSTWLHASGVSRVIFNVYRATADAGHKLSTTAVSVSYMAIGT